MAKIRTLDRKLLRELWGMKGQALAIVVVIAAGVALYASMLSTFHSLGLTQHLYYERYRFADVFASLKRAPLRLGEDIAALPGVSQVALRVVVDVTLDVEGLDEPAVGHMVSLSEARYPRVNDVFLRAGRGIEPGHRDEVLVNEAFALAHDLGPGDRLAAVINGRRRELTIVGVALSPEFVYNIRPGELLPDEERYAVLWMGRRGLAAAFDMEGGFNDVALTLVHGASEEEVIARLDRLLEPYGGLGAIPRRLQPSHWYLDNELFQLRTYGAAIPPIFLAVAAFLLNVVLSRIVAVQREEIAMVKAVGYSNAAVAAHYIKWSLLIAAGGAAVGIAFGARLGLGMTRMYSDFFFHFPLLAYRLPARVVVIALVISLGAAVVGALSSVRRAVKLPPAEAMRAEPPAAYRESVVERLGLKRFVSQPARIIFRNLQRSPGRALMSLIGIAASVALLILGSFSMDAIIVMADVQFNLAQRYDVMTSTVEPTSAGGFYELQRLPGVMQVEVFRLVPVRLRAGHRYRQTGILGLGARGRLNRIVDASRRPVALPPEGLVLSTKLAELLGVEAGDVLTVEVLEGRRPVRRVPIAALVEEFMGTNAYMELGALHRLMEEGDVLSGAFLQVDEAAVGALYAELKRTPRVAGVLLKGAAVESFNRTLAEMMGSVRLVTALFAMAIAFGVVYNAARISLSERSRELATLRVIGFTRGEISYILLGELAMIALLAVPVGFAMGYGMAIEVVQSMDTEVWRMPLVISPRTYAFAALTIIVATVLSSLVVRRKLDRLDLVAVLKTRE